MAMWRITITGPGLPVRAFVLYKDKNSASGAYEYAQEQAAILLPDDVSKCSYLIEEVQPAA